MSAFGGKADIADDASILLRRFGLR